MPKCNPIESYPSVSGSVTSVFLTYKPGSDPNVRELHVTIEVKDEYITLIESNHIPVSLEESTAVLDLMERLFKTSVGGAPRS